MRISTLSIGDELISGEVVDTNAAHIAGTLLAHAIHVERHMAVGDVETDIISALNELASRSDAVIVTGGLGPTFDDLTAQAAANATGRRLMINGEAKEHVCRYIAANGALANGIPTDKQALIPDKAALIPNPRGTACGFHLVHHDALLFFLPGVPAEMEVMLRESVLPFLLEHGNRTSCLLTTCLNLFGLSEPEVDRRLHGVISISPHLGMSICVTFPWIRVTLRAEADTETTARVCLQEAVDLVRGRLGECIFSEGIESMDEVLARLLRQSGLTLALAESCTGGMIAQRITSVPGSSAYFLEGVVTYGNSAKERLLGVPAALISTQGAVSAECAEAMADGVRRAAGSDLGLAVTGIAGPAGGTPDKPVGTVFIALGTADGCRTGRFLFGRSREEIRVMTAWTALDLLRRHLALHGDQAGAWLQG
jgi:nicotinamide-nucleotide amidase